jgi:hypothetical protein
VEILDEKTIIQKNNIGTVTFLEFLGTKTVFGVLSSGETPNSKIIKNLSQINSERKNVRKSRDFSEK